MARKKTEPKVETVEKTETLAPSLRDLCAALTSAVADYRAKNVGRLVETPMGRHRGLPGRLTEVTVSVTRGELSILVIVLDPTDPTQQKLMNVDADARTYWLESDWGEGGVRFLDGRAP